MPRHDDIVRAFGQRRVAGWLRLPGQPWRRVAAGYEPDVRAKLRAEADKHPHVDVLVTLASTDPNR